MIESKGCNTKWTYTRMTLFSLLQVTWNQVQGFTSVGSQLCSTLLLSTKFCRKTLSASPAQTRLHLIEHEKHARRGKKIVSIFEILTFIRKDYSKSTDPTSSHQPIPNALQSTYIRPCTWPVRAFQEVTKASTRTTKKTIIEWLMQRQKVGQAHQNCDSRTHRRTQTQMVCARATSLCRRTFSEVRKTHCYV
jgi:hypothetical protein